MVDADSGTPAAAAPEPVAGREQDLLARLAEAEAAATRAQEQYLRAVAEMDNVRKRAQRDIEAANRYGLERFAQELLPVKEGLDLAVENADKADRESLVAGQVANRQLLARAFERLGIVELDPVGEPFDPEQHEAMLVQPSATAEPDSVLAVVQRGYSLNGRLLRPARVIVAKPLE
ncbi:MAG TPA: nucleotide exchange factor GrpE [Steroidobacteraceae bacterium]|nr:nucleotide exchange factor GrpE [Steroidobacteraceae bacterium]HNS28274.1 nucleotide exchange factor GrpE [Steroidobacteraceae bacterium]